MSYWQAEVMRQEHVKDLLQEVESRRANKMVAAQAPGVVRHIMAWIGGQLVAWGSNLQERAGENPQLSLAGGGNCK
jgi:hypothetical protein